MGDVAQTTQAATTVGTIAGAAAAAEKVVENVMKVEPTVAGVAGMFVPGMAMVQPWIVLVAPYLERALTDISTSNGGDVLGAVVELLQHVSKGGPNSPVLSAPTASTSTQGSG
jgi:hypothetical protein